MESVKDVREKLVGKAAADAGFRAQLLSDPKEAIQHELGVTIPQSISIEVHEESNTTAHLVLPPSSRLSDQDMQAVAGGITWDDYHEATKSGGLLDW